MAMGSDTRSRFESIYREFSGLVFAYRMRRAKPEDADDVFAETFLVVWRRIDEIPPGIRTERCL